MPAHNCLENNCIGSKYHGLSLTCSYCHIPSFFECIDDRIEIKNIFSIFKFIKSNGDIDYDKFKGISTYIKSLFESDSVFVFVCSMCKANTSYSDLVMKLDNYKKEILSLKSEKKKITIQNRELHELHRNETENVSRLTTQLSDLTTQSSTAPNSVGLTETINLNQQIAEIVLRLQKIEETVSVLPNDFNTTSNTKSISVQTALLKSAESIPETNGNNSYDGAVQFEIYISKFHPNTTCDEIKKIICSELLLNIGTFQVDKLVSSKRKPKKLSFVSFKVSTINKSVFDNIINKAWTNFSASKFVPKSKQRSRGKSTTNSKTKDNTNRKTRSGNETSVNNNAPVMHGNILGAKHKNKEQNNFSKEKKNNSGVHQYKNMSHANRNYRQIDHQAYNHSMPPSTMFNYAYPFHLNYQNGNQNFWPSQSYHHPTLLRQDQNLMFHPQMRLSPSIQSNIPLSYHHQI